jgi:hypothetical protein
MSIRALIAAVAAFASIVSPAWAQSSATVNATATLQAAPGVLAVTAIDAMSFGTVAIPNGSIAGQNCFYTQVTGFSGNQNVLGPGFGIVARQIDGFGVVTSTVTPSPVGCAIVNTAPVPARFSISCAANTPVNYTASIVGAPSSGTILTFSGLGLSNYFPLIVGTLAPGGGTWNTTAVQASGSSVPVTDTCASSGTRTAFVTASITVLPTAIAGADVNVGTVTLSASY